MNHFEVFQGDTTDILYVRPGVLNKGDLINSDWVCKVAANDSAGLNAVAVRVVTEKATAPVQNDDGSVSDEECFVCYLSPTETDGLSIDDKTTHTWIIQVSNTQTTPKFNLERHYQLKVKKQGIF